MSLLKIASQIALTQPLSDRMDYGSSDLYKMDRSNEWNNTEDGSQLLNNTYKLQDLAEGISSEEDLQELTSALNEISKQAESVLEFIK